MSIRSFMLLGLAAAAAFVVAAQAGPKDAGAVPRTADGKPELSGVWTNASVTQLTRPPSVPKLTVSEAEAQALAKANPFVRLIESEEGPSNLDDKLLEDENSDRGYNAFWVDPGKTLALVKGEFRTSWIVEPPSGQLPFSDEGRKRLAAVRAARLEKLFHGPEALPLPERCLIGFSGAGGPGMLNTIYNNNYQIVLTPQSLAIVVEMVHDDRTIPIFRDKASAQAAHTPAALAPWLGDSVAWWEGDTLVVETAHVRPDQARSGPIFLSERGKVTERFQRVAADEIFYAFEVEDPVYYTRPWKAEITLRASPGGIYEYACHEGNYAMEGMLSGARTEERAAAARAAN